MFLLDKLHRLKDDEVDALLREMSLLVFKKDCDEAWFL